MKKFSRVTSFILAVCATTSLMSFGASAFDNGSNSSVKLSEVAGETVTCNIHIADINGVFKNKSIDIEIPDNATEQQADKIISSASEQVVLSVTKLPKAYGDKILYDARSRVIKQVSSGYGSVVSSFTLDDNDYFMMGVYFSDISPFVQKLNCSIMDTNIGTTNAYYLNIEPTTNRTCEALFLADSPTDGGTVFDFYPNQNINIFGSCKTSNGLDGIANVKVKGYYMNLT